MQLLHSLLLALALLSTIAPRGFAQDDDTFLTDYAETYRFSLGRPTSVKLSPDGNTVLFLRSGPRSFVRDLYEFDVVTGEEKKILSAEDLLGGKEENLTAEELARRERMRLSARGIVSYSLVDNGKQLMVPLSGKLFLVDRATKEVKQLATGDTYPIDARLSSDVKRVAFVSGGELYVLDVDGTEPRQLTSGANDSITHGSAEFVAQEEMDRMHGYWWAPDGKSIAYQETDTSMVEKWFIADPRHPENPGTEWPYPRPGKKNAKVRLGIVSVDGGETTWIDWPADKYPYLAKVVWKKNAPLTILVQNRTQTEQVLLAVDPATGATTELLKETDDAWINIDSAMPRWLASGEQFFWTTEREGQWQLELRNRDGGLARVVSAPPLGFRSLLGVHEKQGFIVVAASEDPTRLATYQLHLNGDPGLGRLSLGPGGRSTVRFSKDGKTQLHVSSSLIEDTSYLVARQGMPVRLLESKAEEPPFDAKVELVRVGSDPEYWAAVIRPVNMDTSKKYPVIVHVYGGPHSQMVIASREKYLLDQWLADKGYIVVSIDGRGTPNRGREWERAVKGNLIELPLDDQVRGLQALGEKFDYMDMDRVGIFGWSFGGYFSAMALMQRPDVFHAGVAGAPVVDWRDYDTHYTERYMGLPDENREGYDAASVLTYAPKLERPLLLVHGTADDNVYFLHSMKLCDELFRQGRTYEFLPLPGETHMVAKPLATKRLYGRIVDHFNKHLTPQGEASR